MRDDVGDYKNVCPLPPICSLKNDGPQKCLPSKMFVLKKCLSLKMIFQKNVCPLPIWSIKQHAGRFADFSPIQGSEKARRS